MKEALTLHLRGMARDHEPIPQGRDVVPVDQPGVVVTFVEVEAPAGVDRQPPSPAAP
jgi:hypothetical protein